MRATGNLGKDEGGGTSVLACLSRSFAVRLQLHHGVKAAPLIKGEFMLVKRIITTVAAVALVAGAGLAASAPAQAAVVGSTAVTLKSSVTQKALAYNVSVYVTDPGFSNISAKGKLAFAFPITGIKNGEVLHKGSVLFAHNYYGSQRTVELRNLSIDAAGGTISARVVLNGQAQGRLDVMTVSGGRSDGASLLDVKVNLAPGIAAVANQTLGIHFFADKMRLGSAYVLIAE